MNGAYATARPPQPRVASPVVSTAGHEEVVLARCAGVEVVIAIHSTVLGPALGGLRIHAYPSAFDGVVDAVRLSQAMTAKAALAGLALGGGKSVAVGDPALVKRPEVLFELGQLVEQLGGRYIVAEDVGTSVDDIGMIATTTRHVAGLAGQSGDPSPWTARGVFRAMEAAVAEELVAPSLSDLHVCIVGVGKVGGALAGLLVDAGARVTVADTAPEAVVAVRRSHPEVEVMLVPEAWACRCDILAPCALGGVLDADVVRMLGARFVVGAANNQLLHDDVADQLQAAGVCYVPDFVANAGGLINIWNERNGYDPARAADQVDGIYWTVRTLLRDARDHRITPLAAAMGLVERRLAEAR